MSSRFNNRTVLITGASAGIGAAAARRFAAEGAELVLAARRPAPLEELAADLRERGARAVAVPADVSRVESCRALVDRAVAECGGIDILVNNAGANYRGPIQDCDAEQLAAMVSVNLTAPIVLTRLALPHLRKSVGPAVVNVASLAGRVPVVHEATYSATKFGLRTFSFALAEELEEHGIRVAVVSPGPVDTGFIMDEIENVPDLVFSQPMATADEIADLILQAALGGRVERVLDPVGGALTTLAYLFPALRRAMRPVMERVGRQRKQRYRARSAGSCTSESARP
jgi:short-subunit dehydrogenase